ncbi:MAG: Rpn family recombination-promoting nuclease/putative transposase [Pantoea sp.]|nr:MULTISPECIES: Rpn family recombination-promoting nuclease/putative transposase [Pantoea]MDU5474399.1 Rpn family recombination-promoting nuclease/putative transposase [Pantoea sp.]
MKKKNSTPTPHDAVFRQRLSQPDVARDFMEIQQKDTLMTIAEQLKQEGRLEGKLEGEREGILKIALSLLKMKMPRETIMQATGLTEEELNRIQSA